METKNETNKLIVVQSSSISIYRKKNGEFGLVDWFIYVYSVGRNT
jgi:hypothetical protein